LGEDWWKKKGRVPFEWRRVRRRTVGESGQNPEITSGRGGDNIKREKRNAQEKGGRLSSLWDQEGGLARLVLGAGCGTPRPWSVGREEVVVIL